MGRVLKAFVRLLYWGEKIGVPYRCATTPQEYAARLAGALVGQQQRLDYVILVFEEVMFSAHRVPRQRTALYFKIIRELRRS